MMMAGGGDGGGAAAMDHNGIYTDPNLHSLQQQSQMEADNPDSRKRPLETPTEEAGCTKRTNTGAQHLCALEASPVFMAVASYPNREDRLPDSENGLLSSGQL
ncbi:hypothetical protein XENORESO_009907 [Xenotaenia resolanae]|uniref:Uncharacterized protein n=1 Tax=Xenotaenia resolanae TaxID=208358 RepID=A0ABV0W9K0_9TELE